MIILFIYFSPIANTTPLFINMLGMYLTLLRDELIEYAYDAELAGIDYYVVATNYGVWVCTLIIT